MQINSEAPVQAHDSTIIHAPIEKVWAIQTNLDNWPSWQPDIQDVRLEGDLKN